MKKKFFAIYKGDELLIIADTIEECAEYLNVKIETARFISYAAHHKRTSFNTLKIFRYEVDIA